VPGCQSTEPDPSLALLIVPLSRLRAVSRALLRAIVLMSDSVTRGWTTLGVLPGTPEHYPQPGLLPLEEQAFSLANRFYLWGGR
jgi:hypothetical protein